MLGFVPAYYFDVGRRHGGQRGRPAEVVNLAVMCVRVVAETMWTGARSVVVKVREPEEEARICEAHLSRRVAWRRVWLFVRLSTHENGPFGGDRCISSMRSILIVW
jgi:hypothetical protein